MSWAEGNDALRTHNETGSESRASAWCDLKSGGCQMADRGTRVHRSAARGARGNAPAHAAASVRGCSVRDTTFFARGVRIALISGFVTAMTSLAPVASAAANDGAGSVHPQLWPSPKWPLAP